MIALLSLSGRHKASIDIRMGKKETTIGVWVDDDLLAILKRLADEDDRTLAAMTRKLVMDALRQRGEMK
jgi:hypothetical protein